MDDSTDSQISWYFSDKGIGSSIEEDTSTEFSCPDNFEREVYGLHILRERLFQEDAKLEQIIKQISNGKQEFDDKRLAAEKAILATSLRSKLLLNNFRNHFISDENNVFFKIGSVTLSNTKLHYCVEKNDTHSYFLCTLTSDSMLFMSQICEANPEGVVDFNINHTFCNLPPDFKIYMKIYILQVKKKTFLHTIKKKFTQLFKNSPPTRENSWRRESFFKLWKEVNLNISNVNKVNEFFLEIFNSELLKITTDVTATLNTEDFSYKGWLDMSRNDLFWTQRWCVLDGSKLKYYNYPVDDEFIHPIGSIDLLSCVSSRIVRRAQASRYRVLVLEMANESFNPFYYYLTTMSKNDFFQWKVIPKFIGTLQCWKNYNVLPK